MIKRSSFDEMCSEHIVSDDLRIYHRDILNLLTSNPGSYLCGGSLMRNIGCLPQNRCDLDVFFTSQKTKDKFETGLISNGYAILSSNRYNTKWISGTFPFTEVQVVFFKYFMTPTCIFDSFDFTISQFATNGVILFEGETSRTDLQERRLILNHVNVPSMTLERIIKFTKLGFTMSPDQVNMFIKIAKTITPSPEEEHYLF